MNASRSIVPFLAAAAILAARPAPAEQADQKAIIATIPPGVGIASMAETYYHEAEDRAAFVERRLAKPARGTDPAWSPELMLLYVGDSVAQLRNTKKWDAGVALYTKVYNELAPELPANTGETDEALSRDYRDARKKLLEVRQWALKNMFGSLERGLQKVDKWLDAHEKSLAGGKSARAEALRQEVARLRKAYGSIAKAYVKKAAKMNKNKTHIKLVKRRDDLRAKAKQAARAARLPEAGQGCWVSKPDGADKAACKVAKQLKKANERVLGFERKYLGIK